MSIPDLPGERQPPPSMVGGGGGGRRPSKGSSDLLTKPTSLVQLPLEILLHLLKFIDESDLHSLSKSHPILSQVTAHPHAVLERLRYRTPARLDTLLFSSPNRSTPRELISRRVFLGPKGLHARLARGDYILGHGAVRVWEFSQRIGRARLKEHLERWFGSGRRPSRKELVERGIVPIRIWANGADMELVGTAYWIGRQRSWSRAKRAIKSMDLVGKTRGDFPHYAVLIKSDRQSSLSETGRLD